MGWIKDPNTSLFYKCVCGFVGFLFRMFYRHKVYGLENFVKGGAIIAANHTSFLDPPLVSSSSPEAVHFLARSSLFRNWLFGKIIRALHSHPVSGSGRDASVFKMIVGLLKEDKKVILFPEGTRTRGRVGKLQGGIGFLAQKSERPIIPTYVAGAADAFGRGKRFPKLFAKTSVTFGQPIDPKDFEHLEKREAQAAIVAACESALKEMEALIDSKR